MRRGTSFRLAWIAALALIAGCSVGETDPNFDEVAQVAVFSSIGYAVGVGQTLQLEGRAATGAGARVDHLVTSWATSNASIATVSNSGLVTGVASGTANITATAQGVTSPAKAVTVTPSSGPVQ